MLTMDTDPDFSPDTGNGDAKHRADTEPGSVRGQITQLSKMVVLLLSEQNKKIEDTNRKLDTLDKRTIPRWMQYALLLLLSAITCGALAGGIALSVIALRPLLE